MYPHFLSRFCGDVGASISQRPGAAGMSRLPPDLIIAVDGPVAAGKTTAARLLARRPGYCPIESGAMYRALPWKALKQGIDLSDPVDLVNLLSQTTLELR